MSVRLDDATFRRLAAAAEGERRLLSEYVRLLIERSAESENGEASFCGSGKYHAS
jgi:hypothetical protein